MTFDELIAKLPPNLQNHPRLRFANSDALDFPPVRRFMQENNINKLDIVFPAPPAPQLDVLGRTLTLLVITGHLDLSDASRALGKPESALVHEAQAWAAASTETPRTGPLSPLEDKVTTLAAGLALADGTTVGSLREDIKKAGQSAFN